MKYYQLINKAFDYAINNNINKNDIKKAKVFFNLNELNKKIGLSNNYLLLLNKLDDYFAIKTVDKKASINYKIMNAMSAIYNDDELKNIINSLNSNNIPDYEKIYLSNYLITKYYNIYQNTDTKLIKKDIWSSEDSIIELISDVMPSLFFTEEGNNYLRMFNIKNDLLRKKALEYAYELINSKLFDDCDNMPSIFYAEVRLMIGIWISCVNNRLDHLIAMEDYAFDHYYDICKDKYLMAITGNYNSIKHINYNDEIKIKNIILENNIFYNNNLSPKQSVDKIMKRKIYQKIDLNK